MHEKDMLGKINCHTQVLQCQESELFISQVFPYLGASPDDAISCICCGEGGFEIKFPWTSWESLISEYMTQPVLFTYDDSNKINLKNSHPYMQIQHLMFVTGILYCDFEVFLVKESVAIRIIKDLNYENDVVPKFSYFYDEVIVPELFTKNIKMERTCRYYLKSYWKILSNLWKRQKSQKSCRMTWN